jgi:hypothetical protein
MLLAVMVDHDQLAALHDAAKHLAQKPHAFALRQRRPKAN